MKRIASLSIFFAALIEFVIEPARFDLGIVTVVAIVIVANARMQSRIYKIFSPDQQKTLTDLERTQSAVTSDSR